MRKGTIGGIAALLALALAGPAAAGPQDTLSRTIQADEDRGVLEPGLGDDYFVRSLLAEPSAEREQNRNFLVFLAQMSDTHVIDEESPLRVEFTDKLGTIFTSAYRPQEGLSPQVLNQMVERLDDLESPVAPGNRDLDLVMTTGDNTDSGQCNETRWMIDAMTGGRSVDPDSGTPNPDEPGAETMLKRDLCLDRESEDETVATPAPPPGCDATAGRRYDGVRGGEYYDPDGASDPTYENLRNFRGLLDRMNEPFDADGFADDGIPWYAVFGNHDGLIQGNQPRNPGFEALGVGCLKVTGLSNAEQAAIQNAPTRDAAMALALKAMQSADPTGPGAKVIDPDPRRRPLSKHDWIREHLLDDPISGHGFGPENLASGMGNYTFEPMGPDARLRFVSLDTISEHGLEEGNLDDAQFRWLHNVLTEAEKERERVVVFAHHSLRTMGQPPVSPFLPGDTGGSLDPNVHFGEGPRNSGQKLPCATDDPNAEPYPTETVRCLLLRHPSVIAFVNGHEHNNRVTPYDDGNNGFWEINTASHIDWPQQSRLLDIVDNGDNTLSIYGTMVDHDSEPNPGEAPAEHADTKRLASISRELSHFEHQSGREGARGGEEDRNVELVIKDPFPGGGEGS